MAATITLSRPANKPSSSVSYKTTFDIEDLSSTTYAFVVLDDRDLGDTAITTEEIDSGEVFWYCNSWTDRLEDLGSISKDLGHEAGEGTFYLYCQNSNTMKWWKQDSYDYSFLGDVGELSVESVGTDNVTLSFDSIENATRYRVYWGTSSSSSSMTNYDTSYTTGDITIYNLEAGETYYFRYFGFNDISLTAFSGYVKVTVGERPELFEWTKPKVKGQPFILLASEWNDFTVKINEMRTYLGLSDYSFTNAITGEPFTATMYNQARKAIQGMGDDVGTYIPTVSSGQSITAYMLNIIVDELNSAITNL